MTIQLKKGGKGYAEKIHILSPAQVYFKINNVGIICVFRCLESIRSNTTHEII